jgi:hypothetical protein
LEEKMTPMLATNALTEAPTFSQLAMTAPQMVTAASVSTSSWFYLALTRVRELEESGGLIPGLGDLRIAEQTAMRARILLSSIEDTALPSPLVSPVSGGGLSITWSVGDKEVKLAFEPQGETACFKIENDEVLDDQLINVLAHSPVAEQIKWMLDSRV